MEKRVEQLFRSKQGDYFLIQKFYASGYTVNLHVELDAAIGRLAGPGTGDIFAARPSQIAAVNRIILENHIFPTRSDVVMGSWDFLNFGDPKKIVAALGVLEPLRSLYTLIPNQHQRVYGYIYENVYGIGINPNAGKVQSDVFSTPPASADFAHRISEIIGSPPEPRLRSFWPMDNAKAVVNAIEDIESHI